MYEICSLGGGKRYQKMDQGRSVDDLSMIWILHKCTMISPNDVGAYTCCLHAYIL